MALQQPLVHRHVIGFAHNVAQNAHFLDEHTLMYLAGANIVMFNTMDRKQKLIHPSTQDARLDGFSTLAVSPSRRYAAVALSGEQPEVQVYDLKSCRKRKNLVFADSPGRCKFVSLSFTCDNDNICGLSAPDWSFVVWRWIKGKQLVLHRMADDLGPDRGLSFFSMNPLDSETTVMLGPQYLQFYRLGESSLTNMQSQQDELLADGADLTAMCWLKQPPDHICVGNSNGKLAIYAEGEFRTFLKDPCAPHIGITALTSLATGIVVAASDGTFVFLQSEPEASANFKPTMFNKVHQWAAEPGIAPEPAIWMELSPSEESLLAVTDGGQMLSVSVAAPTTIKRDEMKPAVTLFHGQGAITGLDVCIRKPLAVTCSTDRTVRVWNYLENTLEVMKTFSEDPYSVAFHPSGLHVIVGFTDKLRMMNLLMEDIRVFRELPIKMCREVQFSFGGQYFAAANVSGVVAVYNFYTIEKIVELRGHSSKVKSLFWGPDDLTLISCGQDGSVYRWGWEDNKRLGELVQKGTVYNSAVASKEAIFAVGSDVFLKEMDLQELLVNKEIDTGMELSQLALMKAERMMFATTAEESRPGMLRAYTFPLTGEFVQFPCMGSAVSRMRLTHDDQFLLLADETGCLVVFDVKDHADRSSRFGSAQREHGGWSEEILVARGDLEEKYSSMVELKNKVEELTLHNEYQLRLKDMSHSEKIKEVTEKYMQDIESDKNKYELLREEKNDMEMEFEERIKQMEDRHQHELQDAENDYQHKIMAEVEHYQKLVHERNQQQERWEEGQRALVQTHQNFIAQTKRDFETKLEQDRITRLQLQDEKNENKKEFEEMKRQLEDDIDVEIEHLRERYETQLNHEKELTLRYKGENGIMKKKFTVLHKTIEDQKEDIKARDDKEKELNEQIKALEAEIKRHKRQIKDRDDTIGEKEKKIFELKKKNQELEKFKFVLDYKIKELKRQIEPRETEIANMKAQINSMDQELEQFHSSNAQLDLMIGELRRNLDAMQNTISEQRKRIGDQESIVNRFKSELYECVQFIQEPERLRAAVSALYQQHAAKEVQQHTIDGNIQHEYARHKEYLERTFASLKDKFSMDLQAHSAENLRIMHQNMSLIREINQQREANRATKAALQTKFASLQRLRTQRATSGEGTRRQNSTTGSGRAASAGMVEGPETEMDEMEQNRARIAALRHAIKQLEEQTRPASRELLPPVQRT